MSDEPKLPVTLPQGGGDVVVRSARELETLSDAELLGPDYDAWLSKRKTEAQKTLRSGLSARERAEQAMKSAETTIAKAEQLLDE